MLASKKTPVARLFMDDIVSRIDSPDELGVVTRTWHDSDDQFPQEETQTVLLPGQVETAFTPISRRREIATEESYNLVDRVFQKGDLVKRDLDHAESGVVIKPEVKLLLVHAITGESIEGWRSLAEIKEVTTPDMGDLVTCDDWIGQVIEMFDELLVSLGDIPDKVVCIPDMSIRLSIGDKGKDVIPQSHPVNQMLHNRSPHDEDMVVDAKHTVVVIAWVALNQMLPISEASGRQRPPKLWWGDELKRLRLLRARADADVRVGDRVYLKEDSAVPAYQYSGPNGPASTNALKVKCSLTTATVLWQCGKVETIPGTSLVHYLNPDESDCWPGEHVYWKSEGSLRAAVVQTVNARARTASIRFWDSGNIEVASLLDLDVHGLADLSNTEPIAQISGFGVRRGDYVFIHAEGSTNGAEYPRVPKIGELEDWIRDPPADEFGHLHGWRMELTRTGLYLASESRSRDLISSIPRVSPDDLSMQWFGEVIDLLLDGTVVILHPNGFKATYNLNRLTRLYDGIDQLEDEAWNHTSEGGMAEEPDDHDMWYQAEDGGDEWGYPTEDHNYFTRENDEGMDVDDDDGDWSDEANPDDSHSFNPESQTEDEWEMETRETVENETIEVTDSAWTKFQILSNAPADHAFLNNISTHTSLNRLNKEYRVLSTSLPDSILVRAYEDRLDLLRTVIIGSQNTPYQDAPFVIDWRLDDNFPQTPPIAHFLSWTNGNGRVNPNLYEEGKVCLSILGTWGGDQNETWNSARSSLLQAFVSIQGLVLVKEPWFCEPAYEKLRGTSEASVNSRLYSEKAFVLARGFVLRALELPPGGLEAEFKQLYYSNGLLRKVIADSRALIVKSSALGEVPYPDEVDLAVPRLTVGAIIALERTLVKLERLLATPQ